MADHYSMYFISAAHQRAGNVVLALLNGDDPEIAGGFGQPCVPASGPDDAAATYYYGGMPSTPEWIDNLSGMASEIPAPMFGWPVVRASGSVTEADALAAAAAIHLETTSKFDGSAPNPQDAFAAGCSMLSLKKQVLGNDGL